MRFGMHMSFSNGPKLAAAVGCGALQVFCGNPRGWVKKDLDLTTDLDLLYKQLFALRTNGGTEYVTRVCRDAVRDLKWSQQKDALKLIFVCVNSLFKSNQPTADIG